MFGVFATYTLKNPSISQDGPPQPSDISDEMICIYDDRSPDTTLKLINPKLTLADNSAGSFTFSLTPDSVIFGKLIRMRTEIMIIRNGLEIWSGRIVSEESDFYGNHAFTCEGELAYLNDILQPPSAYDDYTVRDFLSAVLSKYNAKATATRQFTLGIVTVDETVHGGNLSQHINTTANMSSTWDVIKSCLLDVYGGHLRVRKENGVRYLDYQNTYPNLNEQEINFGQNLMDFTRNWDDTELVTLIYPKGKKIEDDGETDRLTYRLTKTRHKVNRQYDVDYQFSIKNHRVPMDDKYDYRMKLELIDPRQPNSVTVYSDIWTFEPGADVNQSWEYTVRDYEPDIVYAFEITVERKLNSDTYPNYQWVPVPAIRHISQQATNLIGTQNISTSDNILSGTLVGTSTGYGTGFNMTFSLTFDNPGTPVDTPVTHNYDYRMMFVLDTPDRGILKGYGNTTTLAPGSVADVVCDYTFSGLNLERTYYYDIWIEYKKSSLARWNEIGSDYTIRKSFTAHFTDSELDGIEHRVDVRSVNNGLDYVVNQSAYDIYGRIESVVTWDYVEDPAKLLALANWYLTDFQFDNLVIQLNALDLSMFDVNYETVKLLDRIRAISPPHGMDKIFPVTKLDIPLDHPENTTYTLGDKTRDSYTSSVGNTTNDIYNKMADLPSNGDILKEIGTSGYKMLMEARDQAEMILNQRTNGTITITQGSDGYSDALYFTDTKDYTKAQRFWKWDINGLGFYDTTQSSPVQAAITSDGRINANYITTGKLLAEYIKLYGLMGVYNQRDGGYVGGFVGYGEGAVPTSDTTTYPSGYRTTSGIMITNTKSVNEQGIETPGYFRYFIATSSGVRMQAGAQSFYLTDDSGGGTGELITSNNFKFRVGGITISPAMPSSSNPNPGPDTEDTCINGTINFSNGWINVHHGMIVQVHHNTYSDPPNLNHDLADVPAKISQIENKTQCISLGNGNDTFQVNTFNNGSWNERIKATANGTTIRAGTYNYITANQSTFELKAVSDVFVSGNGNEVKMAYGGRTITADSNGSTISYSSSIYVLALSTGCKMHAGSYEWYVSSSTGPGPFPSDRRFKKDISYDLDGDILDGLKPVRYKFKTDDTERFGFIAQDVQEVVPNLVSLDSEGEKLYLHYNDIIAILTAKVQKQSKKIQDLEDRIARLEALVLDKVKE